MFLSTEGILLRKTKLSGNGYILKVFTKEKGMKSFFARKTKKDKAILQPLSILLLESYYKEDKEVNNIKEIGLAKPYLNIYTDMVKTNILIFLNEILDKAIQEEEENQALYTFLIHQLTHFDKETIDINFHLSFLVDLASYLGFDIKYDKKGQFFNLEDGNFINYEPPHPHYLNKEASSLFWEFLNQRNPSTSHGLTIKNAERKQLIHLLVSYYKYHLDIKELKSLPILEMVFS